MRTAKSVHDLGKKLQLDLPIHEAVFRILHEDLPVASAMKELMGRELKSEFQLH